MSRKICFVAMGFGKKMDYRNSKEVDLDIIYKKVIKNLFDSLTEYELIRADEISGSEIIDVSMYSLLLKADLVIADITTMNENSNIRTWNSTCIETVLNNYYDAGK